MKNNKIQKIKFIDRSYTGEVNTMLDEGWYIVCLYPVAPHVAQNSYESFGAYVILEKDKEEVNFELNT
jgi:hypothetical protein